MSPLQRRALSGSSAAALLLAAALFCILSTSSAGTSRQLMQLDTEFPPGCKCERNLSSGPYRLVYEESASTPVFGFKRYCFSIQKASCNANSTCCDPSQGVYKVELDVKPACKSSLKRVTLNGNPYGAWEFNPTLRTLRVTRLNLTAATAADTEICYFLKTDSSCTTLEDLCTLTGGQCKYSIFNAKRDCCPVGAAGLPQPPPPAIIVPGTSRPEPPFPAMRPPPRSEFPNCVCERDPLGSSLYIKPNVTVEPAEKNLTKICLTVGAYPVCPKPGSKCCSFTLNKMEFEADPACAPALAYTTVDGLKRIRTFQFTPYPVLKVTGIDKEFSDAAGTEVCLFMKPECNSLQKLGKFHDGTITAVLFNKPGSKPATCCPLFYVNA